MMSSKYDKQLDRLLARGRLTPEELDEVLDRAITNKEAIEQTTEQTTEQKEARRWWRWALVPALSFGAVACLFLVISNPFTSDEFRARGGNGAPTLTAECSSPCTSGATISFRVGAHDRPAFLAAFAVSGDARVWYYPTAATESPLLAPSTVESVSESGARIGDEQQPGRYTVHGFLLSEPLDKETIAALAPNDPRVIAYTETPLEVLAK